MTDKTEENVFEAKAHKIADTWFDSNGGSALLSDLVSAIASALEAERLEEREECAKLASATFMTMKGMGVQYFAGAEAASRNAAHAIRNRSTSE